jgi:hypothetical protein
VLHVPVAPCPLLFVQLICPRLSTTVPYAVPSSTKLNGNPVALVTVIGIRLSIDVPGMVALIVTTTPPVSAVSSPVLLTPSAVGLEELHVTLSVKS